MRITRLEVPRWAPEIDSSNRSSLETGTCHKHVQRYTLKVMTAQHFSECSDEELTGERNAIQMRFQMRSQMRSTSCFVVMQQDWISGSGPECRSETSLRISCQTFAQALVCLHSVPEPSKGISISLAGRNRQESASSVLQAASRRDETTQEAGSAPRRV